ILPETGTVELTIYDALGNKVETLVNNQQDAGRYEISFTAKNLSSGLYFYRLTSGTATLTGKMNLIK
ncbi:MAG: T9SS type A sorting domain-containing protein, partial [candidate division WOR-3 bacterium]